VDENPVFKVALDLVILNGILGKKWLLHAINVPDYVLN
jgi:hypothetical protein